MKRIAILGIILLLLSSLVLAQDETAVMRQLNERLEKNKAELLKEIKDSTAQNQQTIKTSMDENFAVLDTSIKNDLKGSVRDVAVVVIAGYLVAFTLSQIIRLKIEQKRRVSLMERALALESKVVSLEDRARKLILNVRQLEKLETDLDRKINIYRKELKPQPFFNIRTAGWSILMVLLGGIGSVLLLR